MRLALWPDGEEREVDDFFAGRAHEPLAVLNVSCWQAPLPEEVLHRSLAHFQAAEFLYETRLFPEHEYTFKHALTHEVAYGSLLHERRRVLHARIVAVLERLAIDRLTEEIERLHAWLNARWPWLTHW